MSTSAVVPLVFWGSTPPKHVVTCILVTYDQKTVITGSKSGQLGVWDVRHLEGGKVEVRRLAPPPLIIATCWYCSTHLYLPHPDWVLIHCCRRKALTLP